MKTLRHEHRIPTLYLEHTCIQKKAGVVQALAAGGSTTLPKEAVSVLLMGPGTSITHAAVKALSEAGTLLVWVGAGNTRVYSAGNPLQQNPARLIQQCVCAHDTRKRDKVAREMFSRRFGVQVSSDLSVVNLRGMEGARVRAKYRELAKKHGVLWVKRQGRGAGWSNMDPINRAISAASASLSSAALAAVLSAGFSPAVGFLHSGYERAFVHDIADLYKYKVAVPLAFHVVSKGSPNVEQETRHLMREALHKLNLVDKMIQQAIEVVDAGYRPKKSSR